MSGSKKVAKKYVHISTVVLSSFAGMVMAVPLAYSLASPSSTAGAGQNIMSGQQTDFAKYAYAFNQGYEARSISTSPSGGACSEVSVTTPGEGGVAATAISEEEGGAASAQVITAGAPKIGKMGMGAMHAPARIETKQEPSRLQSMVNSYNSYTSMIYNSSSVTNTNSNNTVGSNNTTSTSVKVEDSKNLMIGVSNDPSATQINLNDSLNKDSYNTKTETNTSVVNDSFNKETNVAVDSGNTTTTTETTKVDNTINSDNTFTETTDVTKDSNNSTSATNETNTSTEFTNKTDNSINDSFDDNKVEA